MISRDLLPIIVRLFKASSRDLRPTTNSVLTVQTPQSKCAQLQPVLHSSWKNNYDILICSQSESNERNLQSNIHVQ